MRFDSTILWVGGMALAMASGCREASTPSPGDWSAHRAALEDSLPPGVDATDDMLLVKEERFGPAIPILKYRTVDGLKEDTTVQVVNVAR